MPEAASGDHDIEVGEDESTSNIWQDMLAASMSSSSKWATSITTSNLIVLGDRTNGKSSVLDKFKGRVNVSNASGYIMDYSYVNVTNKFNIDKEDVVSRMSVWQLDDALHVDLLARCIGNIDVNSIATTCLVVSLDLSRPWDVMDQLEKWLKAATEVSDRLSSSLSDEEKATLKKNVSKYVQTFQDYNPAATDTSTAANVDEETTAPAPATNEDAPEDESNSGGGNAEEADKVGEVAAQEDEASQEIPVDLSLPAKNLGMPVLIVGNKGDYFARGMESTGADKKFDFLTRRLRKVALDYGAALLLTSAVGEGTNIELLQDYINHRSLAFPFKHVAKPIGNFDDFGIHIPSGFDSTALIETGANTSGWSDETSMMEVFDIPASVLAQKRGARKVAPTVQAQTDDDFFRKIGGAMGASLPPPVEHSSASDMVEEGEPEFFDRGRARSSTFSSRKPPRPSIDVGAPPPPAGEKKKKKIKVGKFFKNLLK